MKRLQPHRCALSGLFAALALLGAADPVRADMIKFPGPADVVRVSVTSQGQPVAGPFQATLLVPAVWPDGHQRASAKADLPGVAERDLKDAEGNAWVVLGVRAEGRDGRVSFSGIKRVVGRPEQVRLVVYLPGQEMLIYRLECPPQGAACRLSWFGSRREAEREQARLRREEGIDATVTCVEVPRSKKDLLDWLNGEQGGAANVTQDAA